MSLPVTNALPPLANLALPSGPAKSAASASGFADFLGSAIASVESSQLAAKTAAQDLLISGKGEIHEVALIGQRAELTLELFQQVRNKLVQAYQEVMRMPM